MRITESTGIHYQMDALDPDVIRLQRMAMLADVAEHNRRRMAAIKAWSDPQAIAERNSEHEAHAQAALELGKKMAAKALADQMQALDYKPPILPGITVKSCPKPVKRSWLSRIFGKK